MHWQYTFCNIIIFINRLFSFSSSDQIKLQQNRDIDVETGVNGRNECVRDESILEENRNPDPTSITEPEM